MQQLLLIHLLRYSYMSLYLLISSKVLTSATNQFFYHKEESIFDWNLQSGKHDVYILGKSKVKLNFDSTLDKLKR
jgi:hypothetical protein